ncbi:hypothetical protein L7F22_011984 [Adiantum nelumboides]|nr:hypothetical protein [Adiantum nelumboides]
MAMEVKATALGKLILAGDHAVGHGYAAVATAVGLYTRCHIRQCLSPGDGVCLQLSDLHLTLQELLQEMDSLINLVHSDVFVANPSLPAVIARLTGLFDKNSLPEAKIEIASGVRAFLFLYSSILEGTPHGWRTGFSASFCVFHVAALLAMAKMSASHTHETHAHASNNGVDPLKIDETGLGAHGAKKEGGAS